MLPRNASWTWLAAGCMVIPGNCCLQHPNVTYGKNIRAFCVVALRLKIQSQTNGDTGNMGYYVKIKEDLQKVKQLIESHGAIKAEHRLPKTADKVLICVVENGLFDAAAIAFNQEELDCLNWPDPRPKTWLYLDLQEAIKLCPKAQKILEQSKYYQP